MFEIPFFFVIRCFSGCLRLSDIHDLRDLLTPAPTVLSAPFSRPQSPAFRCAIPYGFLDGSLFPQDVFSFSFFVGYARFKILSEAE